MALQQPLDDPSITPRTSSSLRKVIGSPSFTPASISTPSHLAFRENIYSQSLSSTATVEIENTYENLPEKFSRLIAARRYETKTRGISCYNKRQSTQCDVSTHSFSILVIRLYLHVHDVNKEEDMSNSATPEVSRRSFLTGAAAVGAGLVAAATVGNTQAHANEAAPWLPETWA